MGRGRPTTPRLSRSTILAGAVDLIDEVGAEKFSIHALARKLAVRGPSIYHYFKDRDELLSAVGVMLLQDVKVPKRRPRDWSDWLVKDALAYFRAIKAHPNAAPIMLEGRARAGAAERLNAALEQMERAGIEPRDGLILIDSIEALALTWLIFEQAEERAAPMDALDSVRFPALSAARLRHRHDEASFRRAIEAYICGFGELYVRNDAERVTGRRSTPA